MALETTVQLRQRLRRMARRERTVVAFAGVAKVLIALALFSAVFFLLDWLFLFSAGIRAFLLLGGLGAAGWIGKTELYDPLRRRRDEITTALKIERRFPELRDRLISVVQLAGGAGDVSPQLLAYLETETARMTAPLNFSEIIDWRFFRRLLTGCAAIFAAGILCGVVFPQYVATTFQRMFFGDVRYPSLTQIKVNDGKTRIVRGDDWTLNVTLSGKIPSSVIMKVRNTALEKGEAAAAGEGRSRWDSVPVKPILGYNYGLTLQKVQQSFEYQVFAGDTWTEAQTVRVLVPVAVLDPVLDIQPPAYTGLKAVTNVPLVGATAIEGATVTVRVPTTKRVLFGALQPASGGERRLAPLKDQNGVAGTFTLAGSAAAKADTLPVTNGLASFTVKVRDTDDLENPEPLALYTVRVQADQPPRVRLVSPKTDRLSVPYAQWKLTYEADDDFGLRAAWLAWEVHPTASSGADSATAGGAQPLRSGRVELHIEADAIRWRGTALLDMAAAKVAPGETVVAWIAAADARTGADTNTVAVPEAPGRSQALAFTIVEESEKWTEIMKRLGEVEEVVVRVQDRQEAVRKDVERLRK